MPDTLPPDSEPQIQQNVKGDRNPTIGQVLGGMVVYGQVIYINSAVHTDSTNVKPESAAIGPNLCKGLLAFRGKLKRDRLSGWGFGGGIATLYEGLPLSLLAAVLPKLGLSQKEYGLGGLQQF
jgi:hypothetical protein